MSTCVQEFNNIVLETKENEYDNELKKLASFLPVEGKIDNEGRTILSRKEIEEWD